MKKIGLIVLAILLSWTVGWTQDPFPSFQDLPQGEISREKEKEKVQKKSEPKKQEAIKPPISNEQYHAIQDSIDNLQQDITTLQIENDSLRACIGNLELERAYSGKIPYKYMVYALAILVLALLALLVFLIKNKNSKIARINKRKEYYKNQYGKSENEKISLLSIKNNLSSEKEIWEREKNELHEYIGKLQAQKSRESMESRESEKALVAPEPPKKSISVSLYADSISNGAFNRVTEQPNNDTIFELVKNPDGRSAKFIIWENARTKVLKRPEFVDGCDTQKIGSLSLEVKYGTTQLEDGKWKIVQKARVKFV